MRSSAASPFLLLTVCFLWREAKAKDGGTSVAGALVDCYETLHDCNEYCYFECYPVDHCNDSDEEKTACAPDVTTITVVTFGSVIGLTMLCCFACFCSPCCLIAMCIKKRKEARQRNRRLRTEDCKANSALI
ncbi:hypothetical protein QR680_017531 [Steinernema hermaphroditum]|uniref:Uncharacterized protein n=1 Tax=Steinernema hermaphroditum TaxID=289476 RepID=A0AA39HFW0_9BILA|nr:hypothetical protein QR680_017531 [Steinernema hermaphroditum]